MIPLHFNLQLVQFFVDHRNLAFTRLFITASFFGSATFYAFLTILLYVMWDKHQAVRLSIVILLTMAFNDVLKIFLQNPRPFVREGTYLKEWAVSPATAKALAADYSTPSGHAMGSSAFYGYFLTLVRSRFVRVVFVLGIVFIGVSRAYLGVHYVEDVLLGWVIGLSIAFLAIRYTGWLAKLWAKCSYGWQIVIAAAASLAVSLLTAAIHGGRIDGQVRELVANCGFLTGIVIACPLELRVVNFNPRSSEPTAKILRYGLTIAMTAFVLFGLKSAFRSLASDATALGCALEHLRYVAADVTALFLAPLIFCKLRLAEKAP
jgi:membrane-associated phospholipid phosphatase